MTDQKEEPGAGTASDLILVIESDSSNSKSISVDKLILSTCSLVFDQMIEESVKNGTNTLKINHYDHESVEKFIKYLHTNEIELDLENLKVFIDLSEFYRIDSLKKKCLEYLTENVDYENVLDALSLSIVHKDVPLGIEALNFFFETLDDVLSHEKLLPLIELFNECPLSELTEDFFLYLKYYITEETTLDILSLSLRHGHFELFMTAWKSFSDNAKQLLNSDLFLSINEKVMASILIFRIQELSELDVLNMFLRWASGKCEVKRIIETIKQQTSLNSILTHIRIADITVEDLTQELASSNLLTDSEKDCLLELRSSVEKNGKIPLPMKERFELCESDESRKLLNDLVQVNFIGIDEKHHFHKLFYILDEFVKLQLEKG